MKSPMLLALSHCAVATIAVIAAYLYLPSFKASQPKESELVATAPVKSLPPLERPAPMAEPITVEPNDSLFGQQYAAHQLAAQSNVPELIQLLDEYLDTSDPFQNSNLALIFLERLMEIDIQAALDYAEAASIPLQRKQLLLGSIYTSWARYDPAAMTESFALITDINLRFQIATRLLQDPVFLASGYDSAIVNILGPPGQALLQHTASMNKLPEDRFRDAIGSRGMRRTHEVSRALAEWYQMDPDAALRALESLEQNEIQAALAMIVSRAGQVGYLDGYELVQRYAPDNLQLLGTALSIMVARDPVRGVPYLEQHFQESGNVGLMNQAIMGWASTDLQAALDYVTTLPAHVRANVEPGLAHSYVRNDPAAAVSWARKSGNLQLMRSVASNLAHNDLEAAEQWLTEAEHPDISSALLRDIAQQKAPLSLDRAMQWLDQYKNADGFQQAAIVLLSTFTHADPAGTAEYLSANASNENYSGAFENLAANWGHMDPDVAGRWVNSLPEGRNRSKAVRGLVQALVVNDTDAAIRLIDGLPADEAEGMRKVAAMHLYMRHGDVEAAIRTAGLTGAQADNFRQNPPGRGQIMHAMPSATIIQSN